MFWSGCTVARYPPPAPPRTSTLGLTIESTTLANGQRVVLVDDPAAVDVQVTVRYQVGAVDDGAHPGLAHLVEHLMFQQVVDGQPLFTHFEDTASTFNAFTTYDATTYVARAPAEQLDKLLALEAARIELRCETITDAAFTREREVVINELRERDQTSEVFAALYSVLYPAGHPYRRAVGGKAETVGTITREQACAFADAYYAPSSSVLVISGNLDGRARDALERYAKAVTPRPGAQPRPVPPTAIKPVHVEVPAPLDSDMLVLAWPLPLEPALQARVRAVAAALPRLVDLEIQGQVVALELGDHRAPLFGLAVVPAEDESFQDVTMGTRRGIEKLPGVFREQTRIDTALFNRIRAAAIYGVYAGLEDGSDRDMRLAAYVLAGRDPKAALADELAALRDMTRDDARAIAHEYLNANAPTVVTLKADASKKRGQAVVLHQPIHDMGQRRTPPDPALAREPANVPAPRDVVTATKLTLDNGLEVVMLPTSSVPTVDIRLVVRTGTADEPPEHRGLATLTAHALSWDLRYLNDLIAFATAGGMKSTDVGVDRTTFSVQGMDSHIDVLLAGLRRWVRDGTFDEDSAKLVLSMRRAAKRMDDEGVLTDTWRAALFGADHPYVRAGLVRHASSTLTLDDAAAFRRFHYTPKNSTLVIAGRFDPTLAEKWIRFLFADWRGPATQRVTARTATRPASIAKVDDLAMVQLRVALPATAGTRAEQLVAAEMLADIARDVRFQLGASYTVTAQLSEQRLSRHYVIGGWIGAGRSAEAIELIRDRLQQLRDDPETAARAFVTARKHVLAQLLARAGSAASLASRVERDIEMERAPMSDLETAAAVQALTIDRMASSLQELDLAQAAILMRGPAPELASAFSALGRTPHYVQEHGAGPGAMPPVSAAPLGTTSGPVRMSDIQPALTEPPPPHIAVTVLGGGGVSTLVGDEETTLGGSTLSLSVGYRRLRNVAAGLRASYASASDSELSSASTRVLSFAPYLQYDALQRWWVQVSLGLRIENVTEATSRWVTGVGYMFELGVDLVRFDSHRLGLALGLGGMSLRTADTGSYGIHAGFVYRR